VLAFTVSMVSAAKARALANRYPGAIGYFMAAGWLSGIVLVSDSYQVSIWSPWGRQDAATPVDELLKDKVKLGGDAAVAAGPVGRNSQASTTELANAEFLTYSRSEGLFAGIDLNGDVVHQNTADTDSFYGKDIPYKVILGGGVPTPPSAIHFVRTVNELFRRGRTRKSQ
jgi:Las17-binding protein actin regulator